MPRRLARVMRLLRPLALTLSVVLSAGGAFSPPQRCGRRRGNGCGADGGATPSHPGNRLFPAWHFPGHVGDLRWSVLRCPRCGMSRAHRGSWTVRVGAGKEADGSGPDNLAIWEVATGKLAASWIQKRNECGSCAPAPSVAFSRRHTDPGVARSLRQETAVDVGRELVCQAREQRSAVL